MSGRTISPTAGQGPQPQIKVLSPAREPVRGVVIILHGGREVSAMPVRWSQLAVARLRPFGRAIHRHLPAAGVEGVAVWRLRFGVRGWNSPAAAPVGDARWALAEVRRRHGDVPVVLVGHSMGGRTAARVLGEPGVVGMIGLAPWFPPSEPVGAVAGGRISLAHGARDRWVPAATSLAWAVRARAVAAEVRRVELRGTGHPMVRRARTWHRWTAEEVVRLLTSSTEPLETNVVTDLRALV